MRPSGLCPAVPRAHASASASAKRKRKRMHRARPPPCSVLEGARGQCPDPPPGAHASSFSKQPVAPLPPALPPPLYRPPRPPGSSSPRAHSLRGDACRAMSSRLRELLARRLSADAALSCPCCACAAGARVVSSSPPTPSRSTTSEGGPCGGVQAVGCVCVRRRKPLRSRWRACNSNLNARLFRGIKPALQYTPPLFFQTTTSGRVRGKGATTALNGGPVGAATVPGTNTKWPLMDPVGTRREVWDAYRNTGPPATMMGVRPGERGRGGVRVNAGGRGTNGGGGGSSGSGRGNLHQACAQGGHTPTQPTNHTCKVTTCRGGLGKHAVRTDHAGALHNVHLAVALHLEGRTGGGAATTQRT